MDEHEMKGATPPMDPGVGPVIRRLRGMRGMTLEQLAAATGSDTGNLSRLERGLQGYSDDMLRRIARALNAEVADFFNVKTRAMVAELEESEQRVTRDRAALVQKLDEEYADIRVLGSAPNTDVIAGDTVVRLMSVATSMLRSLAPDAAVSALALVAVPDDSMSPTFNRGDLLLLDTRVQELTKNGVYALRLSDGTSIVRRAQRRPDRTVLLKCDNPLYEAHLWHEFAGAQIQGKALYGWSGKVVS